MASNVIADPKHNANGRYAGVSAPSDPVVGPGGALVNIHNSDKPTYTVAFNLNPAAVMNLLIVESGPTKKVRLRRLVISNPGLQTAAGIVSLQLLRTTTAGSTGVVTPTVLDPSDSAFSGIVRRQGTSGTDGAVIYENIPVFVPAAVGAAAPLVIEFGGSDGVFKDVCGIPGATNGLCLRHPGAAGAVGFMGWLEFTEEDA